MTRSRSTLHVIRIPDRLWRLLALEAITVDQPMRELATEFLARALAQRRRARLGGLASGRSKHRKGNT